MLELVQPKYITIIIGEGFNNFIIEYNEDFVEEPVILEMPADPSQN